jgi:hypothetical protein
MCPVFLVYVQHWALPVVEQLEPDDQGLEVHHGFVILALFYLQLNLDHCQFNLEGSFQAGAAVFFQEFVLVFKPNSLPLFVGGNLMLKLSDVYDMAVLTGLLFPDSRILGDSLETAMCGSKIFR